MENENLDNAEKNELTNFEAALKIVFEKRKIIK